jgi:YfiH family protein
MLSWQGLPGAPGAGLTIPSLARSGIHCMLSTRFGGVSVDPWRSLNLSYVSGDDPDSVRANRSRLASAIGADPSTWTGGRQVHATGVAHITRAAAGAGWESPDTTLPDTDALWTDEPGVLIAVLVADCVPVVLADPRRRRVAVVHAGWRGMVAGVIEKAVTAFEDASSIVAAAGPSIGPCCYEVGADVAGPAAERFGARVMRGRNLDLWACAAAAMRDAGIRDAAVAGLCTRCESHRFFSHRAGDTGRQGVVACIEP